MNPSAAASRPLTESVYGRPRPEIDYTTSHEDHKSAEWEAEMYTVPPLVRVLTGLTRWTLPFVHFDAAQRRYIPDGTGETSDLSMLRQVRHWFFLRPGQPEGPRPFPWRDAYERSGFCPELYEDKEWRLPRRTYYNKYIPPPKDGIFEDMMHSKDFRQWAMFEWWVFRGEFAAVGDTLRACIVRHPFSHVNDCGHLRTLFLNMRTRTNMEKVKMMIFAGKPPIRDGGFKVRY